MASFLLMLDAVFFLAFVSGVGWEGALWLCWTAAGREISCQQDCRWGWVIPNFFPPLPSPFLFLLFSSKEKKRRKSLTKFLSSQFSASLESHQIKWTKVNKVFVSWHPFWGFSRTRRGKLWSYSRGNILVLRAFLLNVRCLWGKQIPSLSLFPRLQPEFYLSSSCRGK